MAEVVEYRVRMPNKEVVAFTRFVCVGDGPVEIYGLQSKGDTIWQQPGWGERIVLANGTSLSPADGRAFLQALPTVFPSAYAGCTEVVTMDDDAARSGAPLPSHPRTLD